MHHIVYWQVIVNAVNIKRTPKNSVDIILVIIGGDVFFTHHHTRIVMLGCIVKYQLNIAFGNGMMINHFVPYHTMCAISSEVAVYKRENGIYIIDYGVWPTRGNKHFHSLLLSLRYGLNGRSGDGMRAHADKCAIDIEKQSFNHVLKICYKGNLLYLNTKTPHSECWHIRYAVLYNSS